MPAVTPDAPSPVPDAKPRKPLWKRLLKWALWTVGGVILLVAVLAGVGWWLWTSGRLVPMMIQMQAKAEQGKGTPLERPWPDTNAASRPAPPVRRDVASLRTAAELYNPTNVWDARFFLSTAEWEGMQPKPVRARTEFNRPDGKFPLRNTNAIRNGLLGALGLDLEWTTARVEFGGVSFTNAAIRFKGNGTFLDSMGGSKRPFKVDLSRGQKDRTVSGVSVLNFGNMVGDFSCLSDAMAYEFFRAAGVPASRTAYGHVTMSIENRWDARPLGLYVMVENVDADFARDRFGTAKMGLFKPVTYALFEDLGDNWDAYEGIYDPKLKLSDAQKRRVIETARFVSRAGDEEFARDAAKFFDFDEVARFTAVNSLLSSYDGFLNNGQNFYMYLDPKTDRFGFMPWDLDRAWGEFPFLGSVQDKERASIERPWVADNRLLERLFAVPEFKQLYRRRLEEIFRDHFVPERLAARVDQLAAVVRPALVSDSELRAEKFEEAVTDKWDRGGADLRGGPNRPDMGPTRASHQLKRFFVRRHESVSAQLAGKDKGVEFHVREMPGQKPKETK